MKLKLANHSMTEQSVKDDDGNTLITLGTHYDAKHMYLAEQVIELWNGPIKISHYDNATPEVPPEIYAEKQGRTNVEVVHVYRNLQDPTYPINRYLHTTELSRCCLCCLSPLPSCPLFPPLPPLPSSSSTIDVAASDKISRITLMNHYFFCHWMEILLPVRVSMVILSQIKSG